MITREEATEHILNAKEQQNLTFEQIAAAVGRHTVWVTSALLGQQTMSKEEAEAATKILAWDRSWRRRCRASRPRDRWIKRYRSTR